MDGIYIHALHFSSKSTVLQTKAKARQHGFRKLLSSVKTLEDAYCVSRTRFKEAIIYQIDLVSVRTSSNPVSAAKLVGITHSSFDPSMW